MSGIKIEKYFFDGSEQHNDNKKLILVIYDIVSDKRRTKFVKFVEKYGFRVQKSAFEMCSATIDIGQSKKKVER